MADYINETWPGSAAAALPASWGTYTSAGGSEQTGDGRANEWVTDADGYVVFSWEGTLVGATADQQITTTVQSGDDDTWEMQIGYYWWGGNGYRVCIRPGDNEATLERFTGYSSAAVLDTASITFSDSDVVNVRIITDESAGTHKVRLWLNSDWEYATWTLEATDSTYPTSTTTNEVLGIGNTTATRRDVYVGEYIASDVLTDPGEDPSFTSAWTEADDTAVGAMSHTLPQLAGAPVLESWTTTTVRSNPSTVGITANKPSGLATGDVLYAFVCRTLYSFAVPYASSGFTQVATAGSTSGGDTQLTILRKVITDGAGEPSTYTFTAATQTGTVSQGVILARVSGADTSTPEDVAAAAGRGTNDATPASRNVIPVTDNTLILQFLQLSLQAAVPRTIVQPSGYYLSDSASETAGSSDNQFALAWKQIATAVAAGTNPWPNTPDNSTTEWATGVVAVRPLSAPSMAVAWTEGDDTAAASALHGTTVSSVAWTEADDTAAASLNFVTPISGTIAWTEAADTAAASALHGTASTVAWTEAADTATASMNVIGPITMTLAWTEADDTSWMTPVHGTTISSVAWTEAADTAAAVMAHGPGDMTAAWTEANDTAVVALVHTNNLTAAWTEAADTAAVDLLHDVVRSVTMAWTEAADTAAVNMWSGQITADVAWTEADDTSVAPMLHGTVISAVAWTEADDASTTVVNHGVAVSSVAWTEGADTAAAVVTHATEAMTIGWTEAADTAAATLTHKATAAVAWTEAADTAVAAMNFLGEVTSTVAWTESADTAAASMLLGEAMTASWTEADDTAAAAMATGTDISMSVSWTEADDTTVAPLTHGINNIVAWTEDDDTAVAAMLRGVAATGAWTEADDTAVGALLHGTVVSSVAWTEADDTSVAAMTAYPPPVFTVAWTEADDTAVAALSTPYDAATNSTTSDRIFMALTGTYGPGNLTEMLLAWARDNGYDSWESYVQYVRSQGSHDFFVDDAFEYWMTQVP